VLPEVKMELPTKVIVTEAQAEAVLAEVGRWLQHRPPIDQFRDQLVLTLNSSSWILLAMRHCRAINKAFRQARRFTEKAKTSIWSAWEYPFTRSHFWGHRVWEVLIAANKLEQALSKLPFLELSVLPYFESSLLPFPKAKVPISEQELRPQKGPARHLWYLEFVRGLAEIAEGVGIKVSTAGGSDESYATPFTRFVFAVEQLLPREERSNSLTACAKRIHRAIASADEADVAIVRMGKRRKPANTRLHDK
jgi:hypothetical protein